MKDNCYVSSINEILSEEKLNIPLYQRPYEWTKNNIIQLLIDIKYSIDEYEKDKTKYKIGTIILHNKDNKLDIVDGQQRLISLSLIYKVLDIEDGILFLENKLPYSEKTINNIKNNYNFIKKWFEMKEESVKEKFKKNIKKCLEFYVINIDDQSHAFQIFDSSNSKGLDLEPTDLLKAYHLKSINSCDEKIKDLILKWEEYENDRFSKNSTSKEQNYYEDNMIIAVFKNFLFPIYKWSINQKDEKYFSKDDIYLYKGLTNDKYNYNAIYEEYYKDPNNSNYIINRPFPEGIHFFSMVEYYIEKIKWLYENKNIYKYLKNDNIEDNDNEWDNNTGSYYVKQMYYAALLFFYDKFGFELKNTENIDYLIYSWAAKLRIINSQIPYTSINKYIVNSENINMFYEINNARTYEELEYLDITIKENKIEGPLKELRNKILESVNNYEKRDS